MLEVTEERNGPLGLRDDDDDDGGRYSGPGIFYWWRAIVHSPSGIDAAPVVNYL